MKVSECCGATFYEPGYPDNDICSACREHAEPIEEDKPSINVIEMPPLPDNVHEIFARLNKKEHAEPMEEDDPPYEKPNLIQQRISRDDYKHGWRKELSDMEDYAIDMEKMDKDKKNE